MTQPSPHDREDANRAFESMSKTALEFSKVVIETGAGTLRLLATINAGGLIALLGFVGAIAGKDKQVFGSVAVFVGPMTLFALGLISAAFATGGMYFAQFFYARAMPKMRRDYDHPYLHSTPEYRQVYIAGISFHVLTIALAVASIVLFVAGLYQCRGLILSAKL